MDVITELRRYLTMPNVRPWGLSAPILVLLFCLPLLRPLRHPDPRQVSDDELGRMATVQSLVERKALAIEGSAFVPTHSTVRIGDHLYADQPATFAVLLAGPYWVMHRLGLDLAHNASIVEFVLTLLGVTLPVALAAGLFYRMGRLFELPRWKRALLAFVATFASGLVSYAVVLNAHAPAAVLVIAAAASLAHVAISKRPAACGGCLAICGLCAGLAAAIEPAAVIFVLLLALVIPAMRWKWQMRVAGLFMYLIGLAPPLLLHAVLTVPITGDLRPMAWHPEFYSRVDLKTAADGDDDDNSRSVLLWDGLAKLSDATVGEHGILSHFPILIVGITGIFAVMHRHWPVSTKMMAAASGIAALAILAGCCFITRTGAGSMFAARWFIVFLPFLVFWAGAWLRRTHHPVTWGVAVALVLFSVGVTLIGATDPFPRAGYESYSAAKALGHLMQPEALPRTAILAGG